jgi:nucleoside-diphosphate-sugar epimerase
MKVLFIGGTGIISSACVQLALEQGIEVVLLNRGQTTKRAVPEGVTLLQADIRDREAARQALMDMTFDAVVNFIAFTPEHIETDLELFNGRTGQYIFISSASAYQTPPTSLPVTESTPLHNPFWEYSRNKIACEERLLATYRQAGFPATIVRPSHTYDATLLPWHGRYTVLDRLKTGRKVIIHGDGTSLWTMTHHRDFAKGFTGLLGNPQTIGEAVHITSDEILTWNQIFEILAAAAGVEAHIVHIPSDFIAAFDPDWGAGLLGDKAHSMIFDNSKIKGLVPGFQATIPFYRGAAEIIAWYENHPEAQIVDEKLNQRMDTIIAAYESGLRK